MNECLAKRINLLIDLRCGGQVEKSRNLFAELCNELNLNFFKADSDFYKTAYQELICKVDHNSAIQFLLIPSTLFRNSKDLINANQTLEWVYEIANKSLQKIPAQIYMQFGLNQIASANFSKSLDYFLKAAYFSENTRDKALSEINTAIVKEELGIDYSENIAKIEPMLEANKDALWLASVLGQYNSLMLRQFFYAGNIEKISRSIESNVMSEQSLYLSSYISSLPFFKNNSEGTEKRFHNYLQENGFTYLAEFRLHTLRGLRESELNELSIKASAWIERLYLWTWRYISNPNQALSSRLLATINSINKLDKINLSSPEFFMLSNALDWLILFQPKLQNISDEIISKCNHANTKKPSIFLVERSIINACKAKERFEPLWSDELSTAELLAQDQLSRELLHFTKNIFNNLESETKNGIFLHSDNQSFSFHGNKIISPLLTLLLKQFIGSSNCLPKATLFSEVFNIQRVDSVIHDPKLANLLSKANKQFTGSVSFQTKGEYVYCQKEIPIQYTLDHKGISEFTQKIVFESKKENLTDSINKIYANYLPRKNFEELLGKSRASTARLLLDWKLKGLIETQGRGRAILYKAKPDLKPILARSLRGQI